MPERKPTRTADLDYFYGQSSELFSFYRIPKLLFHDSRFQPLSTDAKTLYGILLDRMSLSARNGWLDKAGRVFIIYTVQEVQDSLGCADKKATKLLRELEEYGLIERKRRGLGKPDLIYVKNFSSGGTQLMSKKKLSKLLALYLPYVVIGLLATNLGEAWRLAVGKELGDKIVSLMDTLPAAFANPLPSLHPFDLFIGLCCGTGMRLAVYLKGKNAKKYRHGMEYGSARWGGPKDIEPFMAPKFEDNIILTKTERLMMSNRPPDPKNARNKNVLVVGGSGSGKTRFFIKPNLLQCNSKNFPVSFVVTDPKGYNIPR